MLRLLLTALLLFPVQAWAEWVLDPAASSMTFATTKNSEITEQHRFTQLSGSVRDNGEARLTINLASVDTRIPIRDERMRDLLYQVTQFPSATFSTRLSLAPILELQDESSYSTLISGELALHGAKIVLEVPVEVTALGAGRFAVVSEETVDVDAAEVNLVKGIEELRKIAGLASISPIVPVSFSLEFQPLNSTQMGQ